MAKVLFNKNPIVIDRCLAELVGLNDAIVLQQIHYWLEKNQENGVNFKDGRYWTYNPISRWQESIPFLSDNAVRRALEGLRKKGLLIVGNYNKSRVDRTLWYSIDYIALDALMDTKNDDKPVQQEVEIMYDAPNAFDENDKCKHEETTNANDEIATPIPKKNIPSNNKPSNNKPNNKHIEQMDLLWSIYPNKKGQAQAFKKLPRLIELYGYEQIQRSISRYIRGLDLEPWRKAQHGSTFFNGGYVDYLDENYLDQQENVSNSPELDPITGEVLA
ncbi:hypothetical protein [Cellulosilyticum sp. I15G10I2]|uniref:hypothetical protein n=1 Tax=Cellulosilyticum sp. I15G10I2 TaxID=1892843 RepID=UPI00085C4B11|nr:hypothetical protein [Cellulosilyticum sp. I15G10I2]